MSTRLHKLIRLFHTIRHLKPIQIRYRLYYALRSRWRRLTGFRYPLTLPARGHALHLTESIAPEASWQGGSRFRFLNLSHDFGASIDWNFTGHGKLWAYNLNYFDYLHQPEMTREEGLRLMADFIDRAETNREGLEPFPISLRAINWIKFLSRHGVQDAAIDASLYAQLNILLDNREYHILGNHLLENGFALLFGACYFRCDRLLSAARGILKPELNEQILSDGAHFELSPMYHQIMLFRVLDCINLLAGNPGYADDLLPLLQSKAALMLGWLKQMTFSDGSIPLFNDAAPGIAPATAQLMAYADRLGIAPQVMPLGESGYRKFTGDRYELIVDAGPVGPDYIPGHGHCDMLSFVLHVDGKPCIVDTGTGTYEAGECRTYERSTAAHNTVSIPGAEQSEVWAAFRVARRARIISLAEGPDFLEASHNGFKSRGVIHSRRFECGADRIVIVDRLSGGGAGTACFHFADDRQSVELFSDAPLKTDDYLQATAFNQTKKAVLKTATFTGKNRVEIRIS